MTTSSPSSTTTGFVGAAVFAGGSMAGEGFGATVEGVGVGLLVGDDTVGDGVVDLVEAGVGVVVAVAATRALGWSFDVPSALSWPGPMRTNQAAMSAATTSKAAGIVILRC